MELLIGLFIIIVILGALAGGKSFGETIVGGVVVLALLVGAVAAYLWFQREKENMAMDESANYNLCVKNSTDRELNLQIRAAYADKRGKYGGDYQYEFKLKPRGYTRLKTGSGNNELTKAFGGIHSVVADEGRFKLDPPKYLKLEQDSWIRISDAGIVVEPDSECAR